MQEGKAVALKSGRPHYEVSPEILAASNDVLAHALALAADCRCALQIHAESGPCADIAEMARQADMPVDRVVKHYGSPDTPLHPSLIAKHEAIPAGPANTAVHHGKRLHGRKLTARCGDRPQISAPVYEPAP